MRSVLVLHGYYTIANQPDVNAVVESHARIGAALVGADRVGVEIGGSNRAPEDVRALFDKINAFAAQVASGQGGTIDAIHSGLEAGLIGMVVGLVRARVSTMPTFFPVDGFADPDLAARTLAAFGSQLPLDQRAQQSAASDLEREALVAHQAYEEAVNLAGDGRPHVVAIVQGVDHYRTSLAMQALGAQTERVFVDQPVESPLGQLVEAVRDGGETALTPEAVQDATAASLMAQALYQYLGGDAILRSTATPERMNEHEMIVSELGMICLDGIAGRLSTEQQTPFNDLVAALLANDSATAAALARQLFDLSFE
jgi:hypothetical protein